MINFNQYGAKPGVARQAGLLQQQMESNPVQPYVPFSQQSGLTPQVAPQAQVLSRADRLRLFRRQYGENQFLQPQGGK
jgi:hypothetical protein